MNERLRAIPKQAKEFWDKYDTRQKTIFISIAAVVLLTFGILIATLSKPAYKDLITCETTAQAAEVKSLLDSAGIVPEISDNGLAFRVKKKDFANATYELGANGIPSEGYGLDKVFSGGFSTTESDKDKKYTLYKEEQIAKILRAMDCIKDAQVQVSPPENDGTILSKKEDTFVSVMLTLNYSIDSDTALGIAKNVATGVGNKTTDSITMIDADGNLLFAGGESDTASGSASNQLSAKQQAEGLVKNEVKGAILASNVYDNVVVVPNLVLDFSTTNKVNHNYSAPDGREEGMLSHRDTYETESTNGVTGTPGTDANDDPTYVIEENEGSSSTTSQISEDFVPNEEIIDQKTPAGTIKYDESSLSIVATHFVIYKETELRASGQLNGITFEEFKTQNSEKVKTQVDEEFYTLVSKATGIAEENISILAYDVPFFQERSASDRTFADYMQIVLAVLMLALLAFVVWRSMKPAEVVETEPDLSVEELLQAQREKMVLEDIEVDERSETRKMIDKFVDENPEAAASLLRNWLNDDWE